MNADDVRQQIIEEHAELRQMLAEIESVAARFGDEGEAAGRTLRDLGLRLYERFARHLDLEDRVLAPALRCAHATGVKAANRLAHEHMEQRELLHYLVTRLKEQQHPTLLVARELSNFAEYLRLDMAHEESHLLGDDVFGGEITDPRSG